MGNVNSDVKVLGVNTVVKRLGVVVGFVVLVLVLRVWFEGVTQVIDVRSLLFGLGGLFGMGLDVIDRLVFVYYSHPEHEMSVQVKNLISEKKYREMLEVLYERRKLSLKLSMSNVLFLPVWVVLAFFLLSSSPSQFAKGLIMGVGLNVALLLWSLWGNRAELVEMVFWPIKRKMLDHEIRSVVYGFGVAFVFLTLMAGMV